MFRARAIFFVTIAALGACRAKPVTVVAPETMPGDTDLSALSVRGDTSWRRSASAELSAHADGPAHHDTGPSAATPARAAAPTEAPRAAATPRARTPRTRFNDITADALNQDPLAEELAAAEGPGVLRAQILLDRANFSVGALDAQAGQNTQKAVFFFQSQHGLTPTGRLDSATYAALVAHVGNLDGAKEVTLTSEILRGPFVKIPSSVYAQQSLDCMCYQTLLELLDERYHTTAEVLRQLNPSVNWANVPAGTRIWVPNTQEFDARNPKRGPTGPRIARIHVSKEGEYVHALATDGTIVFHFPTTVGSEYDPSPSGQYKVTGVEWNPVFRYNPSLYSDVPDSRPTAKVPPGPNSPVGIAWIALTKDHVGIHGTPRPDQLGLNSSHGCVRLANWDVARLARSVRKGIVVSFVQ